MTILAGWLDVDAIQLDVPAATKAKTLEHLARRLSVSGGAYSVVFEALRHREEMGCTGLGHGVALPHARLLGLKGPVGGFFRLERAIDFILDKKKIEKTLNWYMDKL